MTLNSPALNQKSSAFSNDDWLTSCLDSLDHCQASRLERARSHLSHSFLLRFINRAYISDLWRLQRDHGVPAALPRFFDGKLRAVDQIRHDVFVVVLVLGYRLDDSGA